VRVIRPEDGAVLSPSGAEESMTGAVSALADVAPVADVARIASTAHAVAKQRPPAST
jgi:ribosomal protein L32E